MQVRGLDLRHLIIFLKCGVEEVAYFSSLCVCEGKKNDLFCELMGVFHLRSQNKAVDVFIFGYGVK